MPVKNVLIIQDLNCMDVLKNINLELEEGKIYSLLGQTGSGKTTLLKSIFGLTFFSGSITLDGVLITKDNGKMINVDTEDIDTLRKNMGIYLGISNLNSGSAFENIIEVLNNLNYDEDKARKKVYDISKKLGIDNLLYKNINTLTYSEKRLVAFAKSIVHSPKLILIDELLDSLNENLKTKVISYLNSIKKNKCIVIVTNNSENVKNTDNIIIMNNGKVIINDSKDEVLNDEKNFSKNNLKLPFLIDLSYKLISYGLIDHLIDDYDEMVSEIWK